jgi:type IV pilus assembly protein PilE
MNDKLSPRRMAGFTLVEMMCALAVIGILSSIAYPAYQSVMHRTRRADALVSLMKVQMAQERYRADHTSYGSLDDIRVAATSLSGYYTLTMASASESGYEVRASATRSQASDAGCRHMKLLVDGGNIVHASGADTAFANDPAVNRKCWGV